MGEQVGSVRAVAPLPLQGQCYLEITLKRYGRADGQVSRGERDLLYQTMQSPKQGLMT